MSVTGRTSGAELQVSTWDVSGGSVKVKLLGGTIAAQPYGVCLAREHTSASVPGGPGRAAGARACVGRGCQHEGMGSMLGFPSSAHASTCPTTAGAVLGGIGSAILGRRV